METIGALNSTNTNNYIKTTTTIVMLYELTCCQMLHVLWNVFLYKDNHTSGTIDIFMKIVVFKRYWL